MTILFWDFWMWFFYVWSGRWYSALCLLQIMFLIPVLIRLYHKLKSIAFLIILFCISMHNIRGCGFFKCWVSWYYQIALRLPFDRLRRLVGMVCFLRLVLHYMLWIVFKLLTQFIMDNIGVGLMLRYRNDKY